MRVGFMETRRAEDGHARAHEVQDSKAAQKFKEDMQRPRQLKAPPLGSFKKTHDFGRAYDLTPGGRYRIRVRRRHCIPVLSHVALFPKIQK